MRLKTLLIILLALCAVCVSDDPALALTISPFKITKTVSTTRKATAPQLFTASLTNPAVVDFFISTSSVETAFSGSDGTVTVNDVIYDFYNSGHVRYTCAVNAFSNYGTPVFSSINPSIATINQSGTVTYVSDGPVQFNVRSGRRIKSTTCRMLDTVQPDLKTFNSIVPSSVLPHIRSQVDTLINALTPSATTQNIYSSANDTSHVYTRNPSLFAAGVNLTSIPVANNTANPYGPARFDGILVAPDILIQANHAYLADGTTVYFVTSTSTTVSRTVIGSTNISGTDIQVVRLNAPFVGASGITPAKVFPSNTATNRVSGPAQSYSDVPVLFTNQFRTLKIGRLALLPGVVIVNPFQPSSPYRDWYTEPVSGDSGSPAMAVVNGELVATHTWYSVGGGPSISSYFSQINSAITSLGSSYSLTAVDLSGFLTF